MACLQHPLQLRCWLLTKAYLPDAWDVELGLTETGKVNTEADGSGGDHDTGVWLSRPHRLTAMAVESNGSSGASSEWFWE